MPWEFCIPTGRCFGRHGFFQAVLGIPISMLHKYEGIITNKIKPQLQKYAGFVPKNMLPTLQINNASFINGKEKTDA